MDTENQERRCATTTHQAQPVKEDGSTEIVKVVFKRPPEVILKLGLFFDGTANNAYNTKTREKYQQQLIKNANATTNMPVYDTSYVNEYTNIHKLYEMYYFDTCVSLEPHEDGNIYYQKRIYIEGVGTEKDKPDDIMSMGTGLWGQGIRQKLQKAIDEVERIIEEFKTENQNIRIKGICYDIFGFSRGAATARFFTNLIQDPDLFVSYYFKNLHGRSVPVAPEYIDPHQKVKECYNPLTNMLKEGLLGIRSGNWSDNSNGKVHFLGLFDTVAGLGGLANGYQAGNGDYFDIAVGLKENCAEHGLQIGAQHEYRLNFSLDDAPDSFKKIILPGSHSDIGGGYSNQPAQEKICIATCKKEYNRLSLYDRRDIQEHIKQKLKQHLHLLQSHPEIHYLFEHLSEKNFDFWSYSNSTAQSFSAFRYGAIISCREVKPGLDRLALRIMYEEAVLNHCRFNKFNTDYDSVPKLRLLSDKILSHVRVGKDYELTEEEKELVSHYIHCSAQYERKMIKKVKKIPVVDQETHEIKEITWQVKEPDDQSNFNIIQPHIPRYDGLKQWCRQINVNQG